MKRLAIIGASGHGKVIADIAVKNGYEEIVFLDDNPELKECAGFPVVGTSEDAAKYPYYCCDRECLYSQENATKSRRRQTDHFDSSSIGNQQKSYDWKRYRDYGRCNN